MPDLNKSIFELSQESYEELFERFETNMKFKGYTLQEWILVLDLRDLRPDYTLDDLDRYTLKIINQTSVISNNYSLASANFNGLKKSVERSVMIAKQDIVREIDLYNASNPNPATNKKYPSADKLEAEAYNRTLELQLNLAISEMFFHFWKVQSDKIYLLNQRVTSLNVLKNIESRNTT